MNFFFVLKCSRITDRLIWLSESRLLGWFWEISLIEVSLIVINKGRSQVQVSLIVIINQVSTCLSVIITKVTTYTVGVKNLIKGRDPYPTRLTGILQGYYRVTGYYRFCAWSLWISFPSHRKWPCTGYYYSTGRLKRNWTLSQVLRSKCVSQIVL